MPIELSLSILLPSSHLHPPYRPCIKKVAYFFIDFGSLIFNIHLEAFDIENRVEQAGILARLLNDVKGTVIAGGDFNTLPPHSTVKTLTNRLAYLPANDLVAGAQPEDATTGDDGGFNQTVPENDGFFNQDSNW